MVVADSKGHINLGHKHANQDFRVRVEGDRIILEKLTVIPEREMWLYKNKKAMASLQKGLSQAKKMKGRQNYINTDV